MFFMTFSLGLSCQMYPDSTRNPLDHVDPFIGTGAHGHTFPGATTPFGAVQLSPDTHLDGWEASSGYHYGDSLIYGFSHTHLSGTGIGDMGDVLILPFTGNIHDSLVATFDKENEWANPGYYRVKFDNFPVEAELTATPRVGVHRYTFQEQDQQVMIDLGHILQANWGHKSTGGRLEFVNDREIKGHRLSSGWAYDHRVFFNAKFSEPFEIVTITNEGEKIDGPDHEGKALKAFLRFHSPNPIVIKVGISAVDEMGAEKNLNEEMAHWDFDQVKSEAEILWREAIQAIEVRGENQGAITNFYTALYHSMMAPMLHQDVDGRYRGMDRNIYQAENGYVNHTVFSLWDTFRAWGPLMSIIKREKMKEWLDGLLQKSQEGGVLPKWPLASNYTGTMVGYPSASLFADAVEKGIGDFATTKVLDALIFASEYHPELQFPEPRGARVQPKHLKFIREWGYVPADSLSGSVSYGLECAYYDWCISKIASTLGKDSIAYKYAQAAKNYRNYFNPASGFMEGKLSGNRWKDGFSPFQSDFNGDFIEGNSWQWSWFVPHDIEGFIDLYGGKEEMLKVLDSLFTAPETMEGEHIPGDLTGLMGQYAHGNEPSHHVAYLYNYLGQPHKAQEKLTYILKELYQASPEGIAGNEDCGQMSAWYVLSSLGLYQVSPGNSTFTLGRPLFEEAVIKLENGKQFTIIANNLSPENNYVGSVSLNGRELREPFISYQEIMQGGELTFDMVSTVVFPDN